MFICSSLIGLRAERENATLARRKSDMTFGHITEAWAWCPPSAFGDSRQFRSAALKPLQASQLFAEPLAVKPQASDTQPQLR
jgi:hypothetical protein